jgi:sulfane dehydrogenase subunit SoxC
VEQPGHLILRIGVGNFVLQIVDRFVESFDAAAYESWLARRNVGLVRRPLVFTLDALERYPMVSRVGFVECGGNSAPLFSNEPIQADVQALHGLASCSEWTGVLVSTLLEEAGIDPKAKWMICEGADSPRLHRSVPLAKGLDDAMVALYQNGERIQPGQGYPMRLWLPGYQGNMNIKFLRRIKLIDQPAMSFYEAKTYSQILPNGQAWKFHFLQEVKSFITQPPAEDRQ